MSTAFDLLREAREQRKMSLHDVADATMINIDLLQALEQGQTSKLPEAYIRAFMREYASVVGLDPGLLMQKYDRDVAAASGVGEPTGAAPAPDAPAGAPAQPSPAPAQPAPAAGADDAEEAAHDILRYARPAVLAVVLIVGGVIVWNIAVRETPAPRERPFQDVVRENENRVAPESARTPLSAGGDSARPAAAATGDSLTLEARTSDSVWVRFVIDNGAPRERFLRPGATARWRARDQFVFSTIGNPAGLTLRLNGRELRLPPSRGLPLQRLAIRASGIVLPDSVRR